MFNKKGLIVLRKFILFILFLISILAIFILWTLFDLNIIKFGYEYKHKILTNPSEFISFIKQNNLAIKVFASTFIGVVVWGIGLSVRRK